MGVGRGVPFSSLPFPPVPSVQVSWCSMLPELQLIEWWYLQRMEVCKEAAGQGMCMVQAGRRCQYRADASIMARGGREEEAWSSSGWCRAAEISTACCMGVQSQG